MRLRSIGRVARMCTSAGNLLEHRAADRLTLMAKYFTGQALPQELPDQLRALEYQIAHDSPEAYGPTTAAITG
ncbi:MAG: hypothetical protein IPG92_15490 [Flavobacteriales bacterium]|nr:hypothetical protein [Flavobacteriales bacterium]